MDVRSRVEEERTIAERIAQSTVDLRAERDALREKADGLDRFGAATAPTRAWALTRAACRVVEDLRRELAAREAERDAVLAQWSAAAEEIDKQTARAQARCVLFRARGERVNTLARLGCLWRRRRRRRAGQSWRRWRRTRQSSAKPLRRTRHASPSRCVAPVDAALGRWGGGLTARRRQESRASELSASVRAVAVDLALLETVRARMKRDLIHRCAPWPALPLTPSPTHACDPDASALPRLLRMNARSRRCATSSLAWLRTRPHCGRASNPPKPTSHRLARARTPRCSRTSRPARCARRARARAWD